MGWGSSGLHFLFISQHFLQDRIVILIKPSLLTIFSNGFGFSPLVDTSVNFPCLIFSSNKITIHLDVFCSFLKHLIRFYLLSLLIVKKHFHRLWSFKSHVWKELLDLHQFACSWCCGTILRFSTLFLAFPSDYTFDYKCTKASYWFSIESSGPAICFKIITCFISVVTSHQYLFFRCSF